MSGDAIAAAHRIRRLDRLAWMLVGAIVLSALNLTLAGMIFGRLCAVSDMLSAMLSALGRQ